jgi:hypothetical protein
MLTKRSPHSTERPSTEVQPAAGRWSAAERLAILQAYESYPKGIRAGGHCCGAYAHHRVVPPAIRWTYVSGVPLMLRLWGMRPPRAPADGHPVRRRILSPLAFVRGASTHHPPARAARRAPRRPYPPPTFVRGACANHMVGAQWFTN